MVRVVHGLRGLVADIYLDGELVLPTFQPERSTDPLPIPAGDHVVEIRQAGAAASDTPLLTQTVTVPAGFQGSLVAHLDRDGKPVLTAYADDLSAGAGGPAASSCDTRPTPSRSASCSTTRRRSRGSAPTAEAAEVVGAGDYQVAVTPVDGDQPLAAPAGRRVRRRHGELHVPHRVAAGRHARVGGGAGRRPATAPARSRPATAAPSPVLPAAPRDVLVLIAVVAGVAVRPPPGCAPRSRHRMTTVGVGGPRPRSVGLVAASASGVGVSSATGVARRCHRDGSRAVGISSTRR